MGFLGTNSDLSNASSTTSGMNKMISAGRKLAVTTWNIAAINNNPFEYWITYKENPEYEKLVINIELFIDDPGEKDVPVKQVFTEEMFTKLDSRLTDVGWTSVRSYWESDFQDRKIISSFMKDRLLGSKRLTSMPDRITNTINIEGGTGQVYRPTVINMYEGDLSTLNKWWAAWEAFIFDDKVNIKGKKGVEAKIPYELLQPIKKAKYPDITEEEEKDSLPLQTMCGAIFDAILVHMMNTVTTPDVWQDLKKTMVENLNKQKVPHTLTILETTYGDSDIFLEKELFPNGFGVEITSQVEASFPKDVDVPDAKGDILAITATNKFGVEFVLASFHGDTNGLATKPVVDAIVKAMKSDSTLKNHRLVFGYC